VPYELHSNDHIWESHVELDKFLLDRLLDDRSISVVHLAVHGEAGGLILRWSAEPEIENRRPLEVLTPTAIGTMPGWSGRMVVSGACFSGYLAESFLAAGASAVIAPMRDIPWPRLGLFFRYSYSSCMQTLVPENALSSALLQYPEYWPYRVFGGRRCSR